jgi:hypothetical protein
MKKFLLTAALLLLTSLAQAATAAPADSEPSPYLLVLAGVALMGTIVHRRNKLKARS